MSEIGTKQRECRVGWPLEMDMPYEWGLSDILTFYGQKWGSSSELKTIWIQIYADIEKMDLQQMAKVIKVSVSFLWINFLSVLKNLVRFVSGDFLVTRREI